MSIITFFLSAVLMAVGAYALVSGFDIVTTERGLALTLCGTMALSIGSVVLALGFVLVRLRELKSVTPALEDGPYFKTSPDLGLRSDLPDGISDNLDSMLDNMKAPKSISRTAPSPYMSANTLAAGAGLIAAGAVAASTLNSKDKTDVEEHHAQQEPANLEINQVNSVEHSASGENHETEIRVSGSDIDISTSKIYNTDPRENSDDAFADLDKLIDELAMETSVAAHAEPADNAAFVNIQPVEEKNHVSTFGAELNSQIFNEDSTENTSVTHVLPSDTSEDVFEPHATVSEAEIIGAYDSGGVTYTLYSDGGVVAEAGDQREEYASLEALKAALENGRSVFKN